MITGTVNHYRDPIILMAITGANGHTLTVESVVDSGFTGWLRLPLQIINELGLHWEETNTATHADGSEIQSAV